MEDFSFSTTVVCIYSDLICMLATYLVHVLLPYFIILLINAKVKMPLAPWLITKPSLGKKFRFDLVSV